MLAERDLARRRPQGRSLPLHSQAEVPPLLDAGIVRFATERRKQQFAMTFGEYSRLGSVESGKRHVSERYFPAALGRGDDAHL